MRVLNVDTYYPGFLASHYEESPELHGQPHDRQLESLLSAGFGIADFYSRNLRQLGVEAVDIVANCRPLQRQWLGEHSAGTTLLEAADRQDFLESVLKRQVLAFRPDVLLVQDCINIDSRLVRELAMHARLVMTQVACPLPADIDLSPYQLVVSSMPHLVRSLRDQGLRSEYFRLGFESSVVERVPPARRQGATFVGGITEAHQKRRALLGTLAAEGLIEWWGYGAETLEPASPLRACYRGPAWGLAMYSVLAQSQVALNSHIDMAYPFVNNMRMYEATGMGALLLTDRGDNLAELFLTEAEVATYSDAAECAEKLRFFLGHEEEARQIAEAGQRRTLRDHSYRQRMAELVEIVGRYL